MLNNTSIAPKMGNLDKFAQLSADGKALVTLCIECIGTGDAQPLETKRDQYTAESFEYAAIGEVIEYIRATTTGAQS